jgi:hypothetical protein
LEVDRGTEPVRSAAARKSLQRSVEQYRSILDNNLHKQHYGLRSNLAVLWYFNSLRRMQQFAELAPENDQRFILRIVDGIVPMFVELEGVVGVHR